MREKYSAQFWRMVWLWLGMSVWLAGAGPSWAVEVTAGPVVEVTETTALLRWTTDVACGARVKVGRNPNNLTRQEEGGVGVQHEVKVTGLLPGTTYHFTLGTAKRALLASRFLTKSEGSALTPAGAEKTPPVPPPTRPLLRMPWLKRESGPGAEPQVIPKAPPVAATPRYVVPPTGRTWGDRRSLVDHYQRHGADFGAVSADDYAARAWLFLQRAKDEGLPAKLDESDGTVRVWEGRTRSFAAYNRDFTTKTFFRPGSADYFARQPGKLVRLRHAAAAAP